MLLLVVGGCWFLLAVGCWLVGWLVVCCRLVGCWVVGCLVGGWVVVVWLVVWETQGDSDVETPVCVNVSTYPP